MNETSIKALFQGLLPNYFGVLQGRVISSFPLKIQAINDDKLIISNLLLIVPKHLTDYSTTVEISAESGTVSECTITVYNGLKVGETVHLLSLNNGKKYYVLDRVV